MVQSGQPNRFSVRTRESAHSDRPDLARAVGEHLTPDVWDLIVTRTIHDATFGKATARTKARDWLAKHVLPLKAEEQRPLQSLSDEELLVRIFQIFRKNATSDEAVERALAITLSQLTPEERATLRAALEEADSDEAKAFWVDVRNSRKNLVKSRD